MIAATRSELVKFFTTRMWWGMAIGTFLAGGAFAALSALLLAGARVSQGTSGDVQAMPTLADPNMVHQVYSGGIGIAYLLTLTIGVLTIGSEYRHKTITSTFLSTPHRAQAIGAKVVALLVIGAFYGIVSIAGSVGVGATIISIKGYSAFPDAATWRTLALMLLVLGLWALIGLGAGVLIPNQVAALIVSIAVAWIVEPILGVILNLQSWGPAIAKFLPSAATNATLGGLDANAGNGSTAVQLSWWAGALVLVAYAAVMSGVGAYITGRRDIG